MTQKYMNLDAGTSAFFERQLDFVKAKSYDKLYPEYKAKSLIPVSQEVPAGADTVTYRQYDTVGMMKIINNYADDLPRSDVKGKEFRSPVKTLGGSYGYSIDEIQKAQMTGTDLPTRKSNATKKSNEQRVNSIAWKGDAESGLLGMLNQPNVPASVAPNGAGGFPEWSTKTPAEILADMNSIVTDMVELTKGVEVPDTILLPISQNRLISTTPRGTDNDTTIKKFFMENTPEITSIEWVNELKDVNPLPSGAGGTADVMIAYRKDIDKLSLELPVLYEQTDPQPRNLEFVVPAYSKIGGVIIYYPLSVSILEKI